MRTSEGRNIQELTQALRELQLAQDRVNAVVERIRQEESILGNNQDTTTGNSNITNSTNCRGQTSNTRNHTTDRRQGKNHKRKKRSTGYRESSTYTWIIITPRTDQKDSQKLEAAIE